MKLAVCLSRKVFQKKGVLVALVLLPYTLSAQNYTGQGADWVRLLLSRVGGWSCPNTPTGFIRATKPAAAANVCIRDSYINAAVSSAWGAECEARLKRNDEATQDASLMLSSLKSASSLCSNAPVIAPGEACSTGKVVSCSDLSVFGAVVPTLEQQALQQLNGGSSNTPGDSQDLESQAVSSMEESKRNSDVQAASAKRKAADAEAEEYLRSSDQGDAGAGSQADSRSSNGSNAADFVKELGDALSEGQRQGQQQNQQVLNNIQRNRQNNAGSQQKPDPSSDPPCKVTAPNKHGSDAAC